MDIFKNLGEYHRTQKYCSQRVAYNLSFQIVLQRRNAEKAGGLTRYLRFILLSEESKFSELTGLIRKVSLDLLRISEQ